MTRSPSLHWRKSHQTIAAAVSQSRIEPHHDLERRSIMGDAFEWSPSTCLVTLAMVVYAATVWRTAHLYYARRSWFYAGILAVVLAQVFDMIANLFLLAHGPTPALFAVDMFIFISSLILFEVVNILRCRQFAGPNWPRTTKFLTTCTSIFVAYWTALLIVAMWTIASGGPLGLTNATFEAWMAGFLFDAALNAALSLLFLVELRAMSKGNSFRPGLWQYVIRAQVMLFLESSVLVAVVILQGLDHTFDPLNLLGYLAQAIHIAVYCELLHVLSRIMSRYKGDDTFQWSPSTFIFTLVLALYANTIWRAASLYWHRKSWFYAAMLVLIGAELYDLFFFLFGLQPGIFDLQPSAATSVQMALDYLAGATLTILFASMNFVRFRQIGGSTWPRTTNVLALCTVLLAVYWISVMIYGFWNIVSFGQYGDAYITSQLWGTGYLIDATLNAALSTAFLVHLRVMARGNLLRTGLRRYVAKAQALLVLESVSIISVLAVQLIDITIDPLWLLFYLAQASPSVRSAAYCMLLQLLTRIMSQRNKARVRLEAVRVCEAHNHHY
ncbi:hypothetical protein GGF32_005882 [Allomyces javanicus]|nr:hypothetical protein GGF32_005882 [Allomyces javanicus]